MADGDIPDDYNIIDDFEDFEDLEELTDVLEELDEQPPEEPGFVLELPTVLLLAPPKEQIPDYTLTELIETVRSEGFTLQDGVLHSEAVTEAVESEGRLATVQALLPHIDEIFDTSLEAYAGDALLEELEWIHERYDTGDRILIENLIVYDPARGDIPGPNVITVPALNNAANVVQVLGIPASIIGQLTGNKYAQAVGNASTHTPSGMKLLGKAYKELRKEEKNPLKIARYTLAGIGGVLAGLPWPWQDNPIAKYTHKAFTTAYFMNQGLLMLKMFPDKVTAEMPGLDVIREDLTEQVQRYHAVKDKYEGTDFPEINKGNIEEKLHEANGFLIHHLNKISLRDIDIEYDYSIAKVMGAAARADLTTDTCEFSTSVLPGDEPWFTWAYVHECMHLDGTKNEGKANYRADRVIEDMAAHFPDAGYDFMLEEMRFAAIGHSFAAKLMQEANGALNAELEKSKDRLSARQRQHLVKTLVYNELQNLDISVEDVRAIWRWAYPKPMLKGLLKVQSVLGSDPRGGYTLDYYKLLKQEEVV